MLQRDTHKKQQGVHERRQAPPDIAKHQQGTSSWQCVGKVLAKPENH